MRVHLYRYAVERGRAVAWCGRDVPAGRTTFDLAHFNRQVRCRDCVRALEATRAGGSVERETV